MECLGIGGVEQLLADRGVLVDVPPNDRLLLNRVPPITLTGEHNRGASSMDDKVVKCSVCTDL